MRHTVLPWESVPGPRYLAVDTLRRKGWTKYGGWLLVAALLAGGAVTKWKIAYLFALLYTLALVMEKYVAVTERGLEIYHQMQITTNYELWRWEEIEAVTHEPDPRNAAQTLLYFTKNDRTKRNYFKNGDAAEILKLAKKQNPSIKLFDGRDVRDKAAARNHTGKKKK